MSEELGLKKEIGNRIRVLRNSQGLSLKDVSGMSGISVGHLSDVERGESALTGEKIAIVAKILNETTDYLLTGERVTKDRGDSPVSIPSALSELAVSLDLSYDKTIKLLEGRRSLIARRSRETSQDWAADDWRSFYEKVKEYL